VTLCDAPDTPGRLANASVVPIYSRGLRTATRGIAGQMMLVSEWNGLIIIIP